MYGHGSYLGNVALPFELTFITPPKESPLEIWLQLAKRFQRKRSLKMLNLSNHGPRSMNDLDP